MAVYEHLKDLYESSRYQSVDFQLSEFLLTHFDDIGSLTLTQIARGAYVTKGSASKFMAKLTQMGTFEAFQNVVSYDGHYQAARIQLARQEAGRLSGRCGAVASMRDIRDLCQALLKAERVLFLTSRSCSAALDLVTDVLLCSGIKARSKGYYYDRDAIEALADMGERDVLAFVSGETSAYEQMLRLSVETGYLELARMSRAQAFAVGRGWGSFAGIRPIVLNSAEELGRYSFDVVRDFVTLLVAALLKETDQSGQGVSKLETACR